jgi:MFS family permease
MADHVEAMVAQANEALGTESLSIRGRRLVFTLIILCQAVTNFDNGAVAATIGEGGPLTGGLGLSHVEEGSLGSVIYIGSTIGCAMTSLLFGKYSAKNLMWVFMAINTGFEVMFAASPNFITACISRFFVGYSHAVLVVYAPVWVDEFAPKESSTTWMSLIQAGAPIGIMLGYVVAGIVTATAADQWRWIFYGQSAALGLMTLLLFLVPKMYMNPSVTVIIDDDTSCVSPAIGPTDPGYIATEPFATEPIATTPPNIALPPAVVTEVTVVKAPPADRKASTASAKEGPVDHGNSWQQIVQLLNNGLFMSTTTALCSLYFVVTGLQLWVTAYLRGDPIRASMAEIVPSFGLTSATAPVFGVVFGGILLDKLGGYASVDRAAELGVVFGAGALIPAIMCLTVENFWIFIANIWVMLFFGGAVVPTATGLSLAASPKEIRSTASSMLGVSNNLLGYFLGPMLCGIVAESIGDLRWGFRLVMGWAVFALVSMVCGVRAARKIAQETKPYDPFEDVFEPRLTVHTIDREQITKAAALHMGGSFVRSADISAGLNVTLRSNQNASVAFPTNSFALGSTQRGNATVSNFTAEDLEAVASLMKNSSFAALSSLDLKGLSGQGRKEALMNMPNLGELEEIKKIARRTTVKFKVNPRIAALQAAAAANTRKDSLQQGRPPVPNTPEHTGALLNLHDVPLEASPLPSPMPNPTSP